MYLGEILRANYGFERTEITIKALELFSKLNYGHAELDLNKMIDEQGDIGDMSNLLAELEERMVEHLVFIAQEYGLTLNEDYNASLTEMYVLINGIEMLTEYEQPEELLDIIDAQEDDVERLVESLILVVKDMDSGNVYDFYNVVSETSEQFWTNLHLIFDGTKEDIVDFQGTGTDVKPPQNVGKVWDWIKLSGRTNYNLQAAFTLLADTLDELLGENPDRHDVSTLCLELKTLVHYSSNEDKSDQVIYGLMEELNLSPDMMMVAHGYLPYVDLGIDY